MKGRPGTAEGQSGTAASSAGVCDDLTSGALLCHYRLSRLSCYMFLLLPFLPHCSKYQMFYEYAQQKPNLIRNKEYTERWIFVVKEMRESCICPRLVARACFTQFRIHKFTQLGTCRHTGTCTLRVHVCSGGSDNEVGTRTEESPDLIVASLPRAIYVLNRARTWPAATAGTLLTHTARATCAAAENTCVDIMTKIRYTWIRIFAFTGYMAS